MDLMGGFLKGGLRWSPFLRHRVPSFGHPDAVPGRVAPRLGQPDGGVPAETDVAAAAGDYNPLDPRFRPTLGNVQIEPGAVTVPAPVW